MAEIFQSRKRKPRADGERTRAAILSKATSFATVHGLGGLSIGRLAELTGMSKSGLFAHFGSKEALQMAVVATARKCSYTEFTRPALTVLSPLERLWGLCDHFLAFVERRVFPGGCFFTAVNSEMDSLPEQVRAQIEKHQIGYIRVLTRCAEEAVAAGELDTSLDAEQIGFEIHAMLIMANMRFVKHKDLNVLDQAWKGVQRLLGDPERPRTQILV